eukprot:TRINITY_DN4330_c0_g1_i1.p1 TRINITY_DN4330_c0_g1~~TRINITY_DN4330_c0_g1_i1.p1  ORF type:complete len:209 (+),score=26.74 TRINITY_DN4330_c0_g1_i1:50-676(+)
MATHTSSAPKKKTLYLIRHGESLHNEYVQKYGELLDPFLFDAPLSSEGKRQVEEHKDRFANLDVDIIICSPLRRALQTCFGLFTKNIPVIVHPLCREMVDTACDLGSSVRSLKLECKGDHIDFSLVPEDVWFYTPNKKISFDTYQNEFKKTPWKETSELLQERLNAFQEWLRSRKESKIAIVCHSNFIKQWIGPPKLPNCGVHVLEFD